MLYIANFLEETCFLFYIESIEPSTPGICMTKRKGNREGKKTKKLSNGEKKSKKDPKRYDGLEAK